MRWDCQEEAVLRALTPSSCDPIWMMLGHALMKARGEQVQAVGVACSEWYRPFKNKHKPG